jgi:hypothetical protein
VARFYTDEDRFWITELGREWLRQVETEETEIFDLCRHRYRLRHFRGQFGIKSEMVCDACGDRKRIVRGAPLVARPK